MRMFPETNNRVFKTYSDLLIVQLLELFTSFEQFFELKTIFARTQICALINYQN